MARGRDCSLAGPARNDAHLMRFISLDIQGAWLIEPEMHVDERGGFRRHFCAAEFAARGLTPAVVQGNVSENPHQGTLRGFHYQMPPFGEAKTLSCFTGAIHDIIVDLRPDSTTFLKWVAVNLSAADRRSLHIPAGCANAWLTMAPSTTIHYYMSESYQPGLSRGFRYNDPAFGLRWPVEPRIVSARDRGYPDFDLAALR